MGNLNLFLIISIFVSIFAFAFAVWLYRWVFAQPSSNKRVEEVGGYIRQGANTFLRKEYLVLMKFCGGAALLIFLFLPSPVWNGGSVLHNLTIVLAYICGTVFSAAAGKIGIQVATVANIKTAESAQKGGLKPAFLAAFRGGAVMGMAVVGSSLLGVTLVMLITRDSTALLGFSFGASSLALFAKAGGGIFTKTADISADLVGKVELGIPEDDPRNPAVIADNVGDNVGDVAGMGQTCLIPMWLPWHLHLSWQSLWVIRWGPISQPWYSATRPWAFCLRSSASWRRAWEKRAILPWRLI